jgi:hypothetical protein
MDNRVTIREKDRDLSSPTYEHFNRNRGGRTQPSRRGRSSARASNACHVGMAAEENVSKH